VKILAVKWRRLGDTVIWTAALRALQQKFPTAQIDLALPAEYACLFSAHPQFQTHFLLKRDRALLARYARQWKQQAYDWVLVFHASSVTRSLAHASGAKHKILHHHSRQAKLFSSDQRVIALGQALPATERDLNDVRTLGWNGESPAPHLFFSEEWKENALDQWRTATGKAPQNLVLLSPGASRLSKRWPLERYLVLLKKLARTTDVGVIAASEKDFLGYTSLLAEVKKIAPVFFTPQLESAVGLLSLAKCYVGSDSGLKHVAAALGVSTVTLFGPESIGEWHPYSQEKHTALQVPVGCRTRDPQDPVYAWCGAEVCPLASHACLSLLSTDDVFKAIERYL
jgi:heptosyltransferase-2